MIEWETYRDADYRELLAIQRERFKQLVERNRVGMPIECEWIMMVEHNPVYTLGRHGDRANLLSRHRLESEGIELVEIDRGGDITFHGRGQLVVYPIIDLQKRRIGVKTYVNLLEEAVIGTCRDFGIESEREDGATGVWIDSGSPTARKICAIGIRCSRFVTMHGLALNVSTDLDFFSVINPCGFTDRGVTSIEAETGESVEWDAAAARLRFHLDSLLGG